MNGLRANQGYPRTTHHSTYPSANPPTNLGNGERRSSQTTCYTCGEIGHVSRYCQNRPPNDARNHSNVVVLEMDFKNEQRPSSNQVVNCFVEVTPNTQVNSVEVYNVGKRNRNNNSEGVQDGITHNAPKRLAKQYLVPPMTLPSQGTSTMLFTTTTLQPVAPVIQPQATPAVTPLKT
ncbi:hypothetical protein BD560DRAFT_437341 [Blakeslea trispora]|nr:hypothetical protein BD560DRAFT_437341 [Blakeslea trispora]